MPRMMATPSNENTTAMAVTAATERPSDAASFWASEGVGPAVGSCVGGAVGVRVLWRTLTSGGWYCVTSPSTAMRRDNGMLAYLGNPEARSCTVQERSSKRARESQ